MLILHVIVNQNSATLNGYAINSKVFTNLTCSWADVLNKKPDEIVWHLNGNDFTQTIDRLADATSAGVNNTLHISSAMATKNATMLFGYFNSLRFQLDTLNDKIAKSLGYHDGYIDFAIQSVKQNLHTSISTCISSDNLYSFAEITDLIRNFDVEGWDIVNIAALADIGIVAQTLRNNRTEIDQYVNRIISAPKELLPKSISVRYHSFFVPEILDRVFVLGD